MAFNKSLENMSIMNRRGSGHPFLPEALPLVKSAEPLSLSATYKPQPHEAFGLCNAGSFAEIHHRCQRQSDRDTILSHAEQALLAPEPDEQKEKNKTLTQDAKSSSSIGNRTRGCCALLNERQRC